MGRPQVATRTPPSRSANANAGGYAEGVCHGGAIHVSITAVAVLVVCTAKKMSPRNNGQVTFNTIIQTSSVLHAHRVYSYPNKKPRKENDVPPWLL